MDSFHRVRSPFPNPGAVIFSTVAEMFVSDLDNWRLFSVESATAVEEHITTTNRALERIGVRPPYFGLGELRETGEGIVTADIPAAPTSGIEVGAIEAAQVARHLAILGSCAAALGRPDDARHHYLATKAHYARLSNAPGTTTEPLTAEAVASWVDRRTARALVKLGTVGGQGLNLLDVEYTVLSPKMFARLNPPVEIALDEAIDDLAGSQDLPFDVEYLDSGLRVECGPIPAALCAGHFPDYPAAPVAIVMGQLCRAAGLGLGRHVGRDDVAYRVEEGHVTARKLGRAGQRLVLHAEYDMPVPGGHQLLGRAEADGEVIGEMTVIMSAHTPAMEAEDDGDPDLDLDDPSANSC